MGIFKLFIYGIIIYFGYKVYQSFLAVRGAQRAKLKTKPKPPNSGSSIRKNEIEEIDFKEVDDRE